MDPYQEEYIANLKEIASLAARKKPGNRSFEEYQEGLLRNRRRIEKIVDRNMEMLKSELFPLLDHLPEAKEEEISKLQEFAGKLFQVGEELDTGLYCQIHQALLNRARQAKDHNGIIRELYWLGIGRHNCCSKLLGLEFSMVKTYMTKMRLCFTEAGAYLKYFAQIDDTDTKGYIIRSRANISLGQFASCSEKIRQVRQTLQILKDPYYQEKAPDLPWDTFIFKTHRQMADSISYSRDDAMSADDVEAIMESVHYVFQTHIQEAAAQRERLPIQSAFSYYSIFYYCGLYTLDSLLNKMEQLMDTADQTDFSLENLYGFISLPAYYCQYLRQYPDYLPARKEYIENLYKRILDYVEVFPDAPENEMLFLYLRQLFNNFVETKNSISYGEFLVKLLIRFAPDTYIQSYIVANAAAVFSRIIMLEEPDFFDDIEEIRCLADPEAKLKAAVEYAFFSGLYHDAGKINFINLYVQTGRQWFEEEYEMTRLHTEMGNICLMERPSTCRYAAAALGHHSWYDGSWGYPNSYKRLECPKRQMVDIISLVDWLENTTDAHCQFTGVKMTFDEAVQSAIGLEGRRFSPLLTARLRDSRIVEQLKEAFIQGRLEAGRRLYQEEKQT